ncbi:hypothetical protein [Nonomuraea sp. NPDC003709]|uniref:hypothetical protein n=1 Tax=Nonomuraea sp. NPDC003709 TaxID=3154450 RepID=UPI0033B40F22
MPDVILDKHEVHLLILATAEAYREELPDLPDQIELTDLDSFTLVQLILNIEDSLGIVVLEKVPEFKGETFLELAGFLVEMAADDQPEPR